MAKALIYALFAMSLNLLWGYSGLWSLGHAAFFGTAGYVVGILTVRMDFENFWPVALIAIAAAVVIAAFFGFGFTLTSFSMYYFVFIVCVIGYFLLYRIVKSPFGRALEGIRDDERRIAHLGYNTWMYKYLAFIIAAAFAAVAGLLFAHLYRVLSPNNVAITTSVLAMLMLIIGSDRKIFGPILGAMIVVFLEHFSSLYTPERWPMILGGVFIIVVMFLRKGIGIYLADFWSKVEKRYGQR